MIVLGIETSCDETAAAVVSDRREIRAERLLSQAPEHRPFGGIVPEIAARSHLDHLDGLIAGAMAEAGATFPELAGVAASAGPGLMGGLLVGVTTAKAIAAVHGIPFVAVNHLEGHALSARLGDEVSFPYLVLLVTGGHCQLLIVEGVGRYRRLGTTLDDAVGEAFDKVAKMLGLGYPGGPEVELRASGGDPARFPLPRPLAGTPGCHFSFSGLKTAVKRIVDSLPPGPLEARDVGDLCAGFQAAVGDVLTDRCTNAAAEFRRRHPGGDTLVVAGGVAANRYLRDRLEALCRAEGLRVVAPPERLCTDNAAMIAWAGIERLGLGLTDGLDFAPRPRWPLDPDAPKAIGAGVKA
ncbi:MAG: tRNA (adenosine(37)-N6)-threonylcarbamoyltransferase complex transferase subunit TsaD [Alphaproteobacteria bacterium]